METAKNHLVLIVTDNVDDADEVKRGIATARDGPFDVVWVRSLAAALHFIEIKHADIVLVDLILPDSKGLSTFDALFSAAPTVPIMVLSSSTDESQSIEAVQRGAQGFLSKGFFHDSLVPQA